MYQDYHGLTQQSISKRRDFRALTSLHFPASMNGTHAPDCHPALLTPFVSNVRSLWQKAGKRRVPTPTRTSPLHQHGAGTNMGTLRLSVRSQPERHGQVVLLPLRDRLLVKSDIPRPRYRTTTGPGAGAVREAVRCLRAVVGKYLPVPG